MHDAEFLLALAECGMDEPVTDIDATRLTGNGTAYGCAQLSASSKLDVLQAVHALDIPVDPNEIIRDPHVTLCYSRETGLDMQKVYAAIGPNPVLMRARAMGAEYWEGHDKAGYVVLRLDSEDMTKFHEMLRSCGASHSFPDYKAHMTVAKDVGELTPEIEAFVARLDAASRDAAWPGEPLVFDRLRFEDIKHSNPKKG